MDSVQTRSPAPRSAATLRLARETKRRHARRTKRSSRELEQRCRKGKFLRMCWKEGNYLKGKQTDKSLENGEENWRLHPGNLEEK